MNLIRYLQAGGAFLLAALWSLVAMPAAMAAGKRRGMIVRPRLFGRRQRRTITYVGGLTLATAATTGFLFAGGVAGKTVVILGGALVLLLLGFVDDRRPDGGIRPSLRLLVEAAVAAVAWAGGLRVELFGIEWIDGLITIFYLVAVVNAFNLLDNMDGITGATATAVSVGLFGLAAFTGQPLVAILAAALCGSSLGFLRHNILGARVYLGNGGSLFIGFLLGTTALLLEVPFGPPWGALALLAIFIIPATDTTLVIISRLWAGRPVLLGGVDHLSHRLVRLGLSSVGAAAIHALGSVIGATGVFVAIATGATEALLGTVAVFILVGLGFLAMKMYLPEPGGRWRRAVLVLAGAAVLAMIPAVAVAVNVRSDLEAASESMLSARQALAGLKATEATSHLERAERDFERAEQKLASWPAAPGRLAPGVGANLKVAIALAQSGREMADAGRAALEVLQTLPSENGKVVAPWREGRLDLAPFVQAEQPATQLRDRIDKAHRRLSSRDGILLLPPVRAAREEALSLIGEARRQSEVFVATSFLVPRMLGTDGKRSWLLAAENTAELRGRGGYIGAFGLLEAENGALRLGSFRPTTDLPPLQTPPLLADVPAEYRAHYDALGGLGTWPNLTMSPNFPSGARVMLPLLAEQAGIRAEGAVAIDPTALAALIELTGPLDVPGIPEKITSSNAVEWSLSRAYSEFEADQLQRKERLADIASAAWATLLSRSDIDSRQLAETLGRMLLQRHLVVYSSDPAEQEVIERLGIGGAVRNTPGDYLMVVGQNMGENKMDYYVRREVDYRGRLRSDGSLDATVSIDVHNSAPAGVALPNNVGGERPHLNLKAATARSYLTVFVPRAAQLTEVLVNGNPSTDFESRLELGKRMFVIYLDVGPDESQKVEFQYRVPDVLDNGHYRLTLQNQATVHPDTLSVEIEAPPNVVVTAQEGFPRPAELVWRGPLVSDLELAAQVQVPLPIRIAAEIASVLRRPVARLQG